MEGCRVTVLTLVDVTRDVRKVVTYGTVGMTPARLRELDAAEVVLSVGTIVGNVGGNIGDAGATIERIVDCTNGRGGVLDVGSAVAVTAVLPTRLASMFSTSSSLASTA